MHRTAPEGRRVLICAPYGRDAESVAEILARDRYEARVCPDLAAVARAIDADVGAIMLTEEALDDDIAPLRAALAQQPPWSDVPFVLLATPRAAVQRTAGTAYQRLLDLVTNAVVLERPLGIASLVSAIASAMRSRQRQFEMRDRMDALAASEAALREESRALDTLNRTGERVAGELDLDKLVQAVVDAGVELTGAAFGAFFYNQVDDSGDHYMLYSLSGAPRELFAHFPMPRITPVFAPTFTGASPVRSDDITQDPRYGGSNSFGGMPAGHLEVKSYLATPVVSRSGDVIGALLFGHPAPAMFDERAERLALGLSAQAAIAIDNARLIQAAQRLNQTLEEMVAARTEALEAEMASRAAAEAALRQSQKMEAVGQLTGGIAHDFNNMLTGVIGSLDIMKRRIAAGRTDALDRFMDAATVSAQRAAALTQRLLAFSRRQSLDPRPLDVNALAASLQDLLCRTIGENVALQIVPGDRLPPAVADANQLENAILNLVINARDAMPQGGRLTIETHAVDLDDVYAAARPGIEPGRYVVVAVSDTGVGMSPAVLEQVFEPFFTTKPIGQGTGLGLSMVYGFARQSGGQVRIHSKVGEGTSVKLYLPAGEVADEAPAPARTQVREGQGQTVLVVEDDESVRMLVREVLEELGYQPIEAGDANAAIPILAEARPIHLMVSDVGLPGMTGRELADIAREHRPDLPILFVTGYAENAAIRAGFLGANMDMITKPFALHALAAKIDAMID
ncbi:ATP-binding protein [Sphingomonas nostoxanthinifaciens]|uniref:ATP-binding protein n=1 Tax=Sphingomonas nostoxanthinifaciens TaxID=2872652 RepID=UPI001CC1C833|nr:ATP-binding protein [Sphingomonas nostoxanthinifaciens]UAK24593.1 response regulator [Sphingomonas nostoxanthinifaciens]